MDWNPGALTHRLKCYSHLTPSALMNVKILCTKWESTTQERLEETQCWYRLAQQPEYLREKAHSNSLSVYAYFLKLVWMLNESNITCVDWPLVFFAFLASFLTKYCILANIAFLYKRRFQPVYLCEEACPTEYNVLLLAMTTQTNRNGVI